MGRIFSQTKAQFLHDLKNNTCATVVCDINNVIIINVTKFEDCSYLFYTVGIDWCIAQSRCHWNDYVGCSNKQYFIIDFNDKGLVKNDSLIGFTVSSDNNILAAHAKNDHNLIPGGYKKESLFCLTLKEKGIYNEYLKLIGRESEIKEQRGVTLTPIALVIGVIIMFMTLLAWSENRDNENAENAVKASQMSFPTISKVQVGVDEKTLLNGFKIVPDSTLFYSDWEKTF